VYRREYALCPHFGAGAHAPRRAILTIMTQTTTTAQRFLGPQYWPVWLVIGLLAAARALPLRIQLGMGRVLGLGLHALAWRVRRTTLINLRLCFPELTPAQQRQVARAHFESLGMQLFETSYGWGKEASALMPLAQFEGLEHLQAARSAGRGVILATGHFASLEIAGVLLALEVERIHAMYRPQRANALVDHWIHLGRSRAAELFEKYEVRRMFASLAGNHMVVYLADQAYRRRRSAVLPFFGQPAMTNTSLSHIARISGAAVVPFLPLRMPGPRYVLRFLPALEDFPGDDPLEDTLRMNRILEAHIRADPSQYLWAHKRFKGLPEAYPDVYA
jgi:Kdo2-lipid IVA lauroyltransferase/acyltransferase